MVVMNGWPLGVQGPDHHGIVLECAAISNKNRLLQLKADMVSGWFPPQAAEGKFSSPFQKIQRGPSTYGNISEAQVECK